MARHCILTPIDDDTPNLRRIARAWDGVRLDGTPVGDLPYSDNGRHRRQGWVSLVKLTA
ncbi:hypothetical protein SEA_LOZINAK_185 [Gordonia phage Lozinak]|uniref:Uncharacterized protein n=3 Tax=Smoothievirus TaxID=1982557 RepID=A0A2D1GG30_9CAUD|nr:hypothetical protein BH768_gp022 [Gordonia phage ClubL]YP_009281338.1 hypothetical protein BIZ74_gp021 [Gordonia phage Cucurbita]ATN90811.1 hypothetical protein SEA_LOZINAK_185 [Gordonia phage Lozinak]AUE23567.1 hypothetical protein SEA_TONIANN_185 [Gordonia phage Toniann]QAU07045.1 hypothetical protein SEA_APHELION_182 [Gordonia phage Aphelion]QKY79760.1 hypothetical protein SEA_ENGINEER_186 [Gordonia Phage Engineer]QYC53666.1 hypothetical protein SEA_NORVS_182 [Gordonia phage Norvs]